MTQDEKAEALQTIVAETQRLRTLAKRSGADMLAFLLENALHEARATLIGAGHEPHDHAPSGGGQSGPTVVSLRPPGKPRTR